MCSLVPRLVDIVTTVLSFYQNLDMTTAAKSRVINMYISWIIVHSDLAFNCHLLICSLLLVVPIVLTPVTSQELTLMMVVNHLCEVTVLTGVNMIVQNTIM